METSGKGGREGVKAGRVPPIAIGNQPECVEELVTSCIVFGSQECVYQEPSFASRRDRGKRAKTELETGRNDSEGSKS